MPTHLIFKTSRSAISAVGRRTRRRRMERLKAVMGLGPGLKILDLGGRPEIWESIPEKLDITILNLPGETGSSVPTHHDVKFVDGDACDARQFPDRSFDLVFSNSVIEHVGPEERQAAFAREVRRLARSYWVQTPSKWFPIEAHTGMPLWWLYPEAMRQLFLKRWRSQLEKWANSMADTRVLTREQLERLFPASNVSVESLAGIPKSYAVYSRSH